MNTILEVRQPGPFTTVQDLGRTGYLAVGLTASGALDRIGLALANALVGNASGMAALELVLSGPKLSVSGAPARIALAGPVEAVVARAGGEPMALPAYRSLLLDPGDTLEVGRITGAATAYLAVEGGVDLPPVLGSRATFQPGGIGGIEGRALATGDRLVVPAATDRSDLEVADPGRLGVLHAAGPVRVVLGPQLDRFPDGAVETFLSSDYAVGRASNRMGLRLEGPALAHTDGYEIESEGIAPGAIQVPGSGLPIVLLAERQTMGGYTKIATVASVDLPRCGRLMVGDTIRFQAIGRAEAEAARRDQEAALRGVIEGLSPAGPLGAPSVDRLLDANLISGVVDAGRPPEP